MLHGPHNDSLVVLSTGLAVLAAFITRAVVDRVVASRQELPRRMWTVVGALTMGLGVWAMHFTAMLAIHFPIPVSYDPVWTFVSMCPAVAGSGGAIALLGHRQPRPMHRVLGGLAFGGGVAAMHYAGMEAMRMGATLSYRADLFVVSIIVVIALSAFALWVRPIIERVLGDWLLSRVVGAILVGLAVTAMHHTAMLATQVELIAGAPAAEPGIAPDLLSLLVSGSVTVLIGLTLLATLIDRRFMAITDSLEAAETLHRTVLECLSDVVLTCNEQGLIVSANRAAVAQFGYPAGSLIGRPLDALLPGALHWSQQTNGEPRRHLRATRASGDQFPVDVALGIMTIGGARVTGFVVRDMTAHENDVRRLEEAAADLERQSQALTLERDRAESATRAKSEFLSTMSHEIRTPMSGVIGMADLLLRSHLSPAQSEQVHIIQASGESLLQLLNDILDLSKIEAGRVDLEAVSFDPVAEIRAIQKLLLPVAEQKGIDLQVNIADVTPALVGDRRRIRQIVLNLMTNAVKFTEHGTVRVVVEGGHDAEAWRFRVSVSDTGVGIHAAAQARLFQSFSQAETSTSRRFGGTGLGLAISRRLVGLMGGQIGMTSQAGRGCTFWFELRLPIAPAGTTSDASPASLGQSSGGRRWSVLVAEDNTVNQIVMQRLLQHMDCDVTIVDNGGRAVEAWRLGTFDVILMDCNMPEMDGFEATHLIRALEQGDHRTAIAAVTANAFEEDQEQCRRAGMDDYVAKPVTLRGLEDLFIRLTERHLLHVGGPRHAEPRGNAPTYPLMG